MVATFYFRYHFVKNDIRYHVEKQIFFYNTNGTSFFKKLTSFIRFFWNNIIYFCKIPPCYALDNLHVNQIHRTNMRSKNIYTELPVEEIVETDKPIASAPETNLNRAQRNRRRSKKPKGVSQSSDSSNVVELSKLCISNMTEDSKSCNFANITHKKVTGANNWKSFLEKNKSSQVANKENDEFTVDVEVDDARSKRKKVNSIVAIDCEMVGIGEDGKENMLARVSIVNSLGECLYDTFVKPTAPVTDYRTPVSGVRPCDLKNAEKFLVAQKRVMELLNGRILVGHAVHNDLIVLKIRHPRHKIRDTTRFKKFYQIGCGTPSLKKLTSHFLNVDIQCGEHNSIQDAQAAMQLYMLYRKEWETDIKKRIHQSHHNQQHNHSKKKSKSSHKPKRFSKNYKK